MTLFSISWQTRFSNHGHLTNAEKAALKSITFEAASKSTNMT